MQNIFEYAAHEVANKDVVARAWHSAKIHSTRSAFMSKGSFGSKLIRTLGVAGRAVAGCIPFPIVGGIIAAAENAIESKIRSMIHEKKRDTRLTVRNKVKFALKEMSVENLDRYRAKLEFAVNDLNSAVANHASTLDSYAGLNKPCNAFWQLALAVAQAERRAMILMTACEEIGLLMQMTRYLAYKTSTGQTMVFPEPELQGAVEANSITGIKKSVISQYLAYVNGELANANNFDPDEGLRGAVNAPVAIPKIHKEAAGMLAAYKFNQNFDYAQNGPAAQPSPNPPQVQHQGELRSPGAIAYADMFHAKCDDRCCFAELPSDAQIMQWDLVKNNISSMMNLLAVFSPTDFVSGLTLPPGSTGFYWGE